MSASAASVNREKRATSVAHNRSALPSPSQTAGEPSKVRTRSAADAQAQPKQTNKYTDAREFLSSVHLLAENAPCTVQTLSGVLHLMAERYKMPDNVAKALGHVAVMILHIESQQQKCEGTTTLPALIKELQVGLNAEIDAKLNAMEKRIALPVLAQEKLESATKQVEQAAESIKTSINVMGSSIAQVTDTSTQLACTATNYKDALLRSGEHQPRPRSPVNSPQTDPKILRDVDRKTRQILIDTLDIKILEASLAEIKEKVSAAINSVTNPPPPKDSTIVEVSKLRKGGFTVLFKHKEVVDWLQDPGVELNFASQLAADATIAKRTYSILVPRVPLTFNPDDKKHLREVEECNELPEGTLEKARWIKPINRRAPGQRAAHAIFAVKDVSIANVSIRDGIRVCGLRIYPSRLKHEPMQCMKCRKWGHFAHACTAETDTCGTCGGEHRTSDCNNRAKTFCVSCKSNEHASWDRGCPEFRRRCAQYDENYPENSLPYFPTDEDWTLTARPDKLQLTDKFPAKYTVSAYPHPNQANRAPAAKNSGKRRKQQPYKVPANQSTMDQFIPPANPTNATDGTTAGTHIPTYDFTAFGGDSEPQGWE
jgi:prefoldin subunit 5